MSEPTYELSWPAQRKSIRADAVSNRSILRLLVYFVLAFFVLGYGSRMLPNAEQIEVYTP